MRRALLLLALFAAAPLRAQVVDLVFKTDDLVFNVLDMGGKVEDLAVRETDTEVHIDLAADVLFDFDKADLLPKAEQTLQKAADLIRQRNAKGVVRIEGHTDAKGSDAYNQTLSERRAAAVKRWFESHGLHERFATAGFGAKKPVAPNAKPDGSDDAEGRAKNRRVEIVIKKQD
jgi:outer membrane protein OmpA-like peptidoglycan-associated protein